MNMLKLDYKKRKGFSKKKKKMQREQLLIRRHPEIYSQILSIGVEKPKAVMWLEERKPNDLETIIQQYERFVEMSCVTGINMTGIKRTKNVMAWIESMTAQNLLIDKGYILKFPPNVQLGRF